MLHGQFVHFSVTILDTFLFSVTKHIPSELLCACSILIGAVFGSANLFFHLLEVISVPWNLNGVSGWTN